MKNCLYCLWFDKEKGDNCSWCDKKKIFSPDKKVSESDRKKCFEPLMCKTVNKVEK